MSLEIDPLAGFRESGMDWYLLTVILRALREHDLTLIATTGQKRLGTLEVHSVSALELDRGKFGDILITDTRWLVLASGAAKVFSLALQTTTRVPTLTYVLARFSESIPAL